ncbi:MAG: hypothetical protein AB1489_30000 [Acidobacteriota bacterium]
MKMGELIKEYISFTYFYPEDQNGKPLFPYFTNKGLMYGADDYALDPDVFAWRYLNSYASTALDYEFNSAQEGTLHEIEFLSPYTRRDDNIGSYTTFLQGYIFVKSGFSIPWQKMLREIQIGGERKTGWGKLRLQGEPVVTTNLFDLLECDFTTDRPRVKVEFGKPLLAHTLVNKTNNISKDLFQVSGEVEPLVSRAWAQDKGAGKLVELIAICYLPGSILTSNTIQWFEFNRDCLWVTK